MRTSQAPSIDFNQMLVVSVFFHFFLFVIVMFLPHTQNMVKHVTPAFMVSLVNFPTGPEANPVPPMEEAPVAPENSAPPAEETPVVPKKSEASKALVSKLEQLAKLNEKIPQKKVVVPSKPVLDDTFQELDSLKNKVVPKKNKAAMTTPAPVERVLKDFEEKKVLTKKEKEFERLSKLKATDKTKKHPKKTSNLLKDLEDLGQLNKQASVALAPSKSKKSNSKTDRLLKELESIKKNSIQMKIDTSKLSSSHSPKFKSEIRNFKMADLRNKKTGPAASGEPGDPGADALSTYLGQVELKLLEHWKDPVGGGNGMVQVSFTIFPKGNIAMPKILKSSGDRELDNLALRAIKNAVPLPPFPINLKEPNLPLTYGFTYDPS